MIRRWRHAFAFGVAALIVLGLGAGLHYKFCGTPKPYYFATEKYRFMIDPQTPNHWILSPTNPGLTEAKLEARLKEVHAPAGVTEYSLSEFRKQQATPHNRLHAALHQWKTYDYLTFNPLVFSACC